jgi:alpha-galactosidase
MKQFLFASVALVLAIAPLSVGAQVGIHPQPDGTSWTLQAGTMSYGIGVNEQGMLQTLYWGQRLGATIVLPAAKSKPERASFDPPTATTPLEYPAWGAGLFTEPALKVGSPNGDRTLVLHFQAAKIQEGVLEITLRDEVQPIFVHLFYQPYPEGVLARWSVIENHGDKPYRVEQAASATWNLPQGEGYEASWLTGQWGAEWQLHTAPVQPGTLMIESRRGSTSHQANPWFAIGRTGETTETAGPVWFGELAWSGSWRMSVEDTALHQVRVTAGYNPFDFAYLLQPGQHLETPRFFAGYTAKGQGEASRILHRFQLAEILPSHPQIKPRPVIYNSWEATEFAVNEPGQIALAERAAKLGVERFVIDDGWFGERNTDHAGLGDWTVNPAKFPHGLKPMIDRVHALGMSFGIWVEPEMVNPDSQLYRKHPEWAMQFPDRKATLGRNQMLLNLAREDVKEYTFTWLDKLVSENDIAFLKWDYNRNWSEPGWDTAPAQANGTQNPDAQKAIYVQYVQNLYEILARLKARHPKLEIESCSGGGGRVDLGILRYTDEVWPSDNTDGLDRLSIQYGFTHAYSPQTMAAWVTDVPNFLDRRSIPLQFRFLSAMQGALGIGGNLNKWTAEDMSTATRMVDFYKQVRPTVQQGELYRLRSPVGRETSQVEYLSADGSEGVLFAYLRSQQYGMAYEPVRLQGLAPEAIYQVLSLDSAKYKGPEHVSGAELMESGIQLGLSGDYDGTAIRLVRVGAKE